MVLSNKEWLDKMNEIISAIKNGGGDSQVIEDMLSNMWISSATYNVGDYVLYDNNIWKCLVQNSNITPSEGNIWTRVNITSEISTLNSNLVEIMSVERYDLNLRTIPTNTEVIMHTITTEKDIFMNIKASIRFRDDSNIGVRSVTVKIDNVIYDEQQQGKTTSWTIINNVSYLGLLKAGSTLSIVVYQNSGENADVDGRISVNH